MASSRQARGELIASAFSRVANTDTSAVQEEVPHSAAAAAAFMSLVQQQSPGSQLAAQAWTQLGDHVLRILALWSVSGHSARNVLIWLVRNGIGDGDGFASVAVFQLRATLQREKLPRRV